MLNAINQYKLDTHLGDYQKGSLIDLSQESYDFFKSYFGIKRQFKGEVFFYPENNIFLGKETPNSLVATIDNIVYKIYYHFNSENRDACITFRNKLINHVVQYMTPEIFNNVDIKEITPDFKVMIWNFDWGNLLIELGPVFETSYIITSSRVKRAKRISFLDRLFNKH